MMSVDELLKKAETYGCFALKGQSGKVGIAGDYTGIAIITDSGMAHIGVENAAELLTILKIAIQQCKDELNKLSLDELNELARKKGMSYGQFKGAVGMWEETK